MNPPQKTRRYRFISPPQQLIVSLLMSAAVLGLTTLAHAQQDSPKRSAEERAPRPSLDPQKLPYLAFGNEIPRYYLVRQFFVIANSRFQSGGEFYERLLSDLDVEVGSKAEGALRRALERAFILEGGDGSAVTTVKHHTVPSKNGDLPAVSTMTVGRSQPDPASQPLSREELIAKNVKKAQGLASIYAELLDELTSTPMAGTGLERFLYHHVAAHSTVSSDRPFSDPEPQVIAFDKQLEMLADR